MKRIGFVGAGNMGSAMIHAISNKQNDMVFVYDINSESYKAFNECNVDSVDTLQEMTKRAEYIVLTIKPQYYVEVAKQLAPFITKEHIIVTVAPGYSIERMKSILGQDVKVIRTMPNTPALVGKGITAYSYRQEEIVEEEIDMFLTYFKSFGECIEIKEEQMEAVVAVTGSSPAYGYIFIEAMADAGVKFGLSRAMAYKMSALAIQGACEMILQTGKCPGELKDAVASPGGTTIEAIVKLEEEGFRNSIIAAMTACYDKAKEMNH